MKRFLILDFPIRNAEIILEMVDRFFNIYTDLTGIFPFLGTTLYTWISAKVLSGQIKLSAKNFAFEDNKKIVPLYAAFCI